MSPFFFTRHLPALGLGLALALPAARCACLGGAARRHSDASGPHADGRDSFSLATMRGKVILVVFWFTDCASCYQKMPELRANAQGWRRKPFELVTISVDRKLKNLTDYEKLVRTVVSKDEHLLALWAGDPAYRDSLGKPTGSLPVAYLLDKQGRVVKQYSGRIPPEAWDRIADLL